MAEEAFCEAAGCDHTHSSVIECCYDRAVELLWYEDEIVKSAAVRLTIKCGQMFAVSKKQLANAERMDAIFVQIVPSCGELSLDSPCVTAIVLLIHHPSQRAELAGRNWT